MYHKHSLALWVLILMLQGISASTTVFADAGKCYVLVEKSDQFDPDVVVSSAVSIISRYIQPVEAPPPGGLKLDDCTYTVNLNLSLDGFFISLSGKRLNSIGNSDKQGMDGFTQSLLRAVYRTFDSEKMKNKICKDYADLLENDCKPVQAVVFLFNHRGEMIPQGAIVRENDRFNIMIQPINDLYAYIVALDSSGNLFRVFPNTEVSSQVNPLKSGSQYFFPPLKSEVIFAFDNIPGEEKLYFLFSSTPVNEIDAFFQNLEDVNTEIERQKAVKSFERRFTSRGFKLKKKQQKITLNQMEGIQQMSQQKVIAELLKGSGVMVKSVTLRHVQ